MTRIDIFSISSDIVLRWMPQDVTHDRSILVQAPGGGTPSLRVSRYAPRFCPPFSASGRSFCPPKFYHIYYFIQILLGPISKPHIFQHVDALFDPKLTKSIILFRSCWVPFWTSSDAPLILTWSAPPPPPIILLPTKVQLILEVWWYMISCLCPSFQP